MCDTSPLNPWQEVAEEQQKLELLLHFAGDDPEALRTAARSVGSPALRSLAGLALESLEAGGGVGDEKAEGIRIPDLAARIGSIRTLRDSGDSQYLPELKRRVPREEVPSARLELIEAIAALGGAREWPFLARCFADPEKSIRLRLLELALVLPSQEERFALILKALRDPERAVKDRAMAALMVSGAPGRDVSGSPAYEEPRLNDGDKIALARQLVQREDPDMLPLLRRLIEGEESAPVTLEALRTLTVIGTPEDTPSIRNCLGRPEPEVSAQALLTLAVLGDRTELDRARQWTLESDRACLHASAGVYLLAAGEELRQEDRDSRPSRHSAALVEHVRMNVAAIKCGDRARVELYRQTRPDLLTPTPAKLIALLLFFAALYVWLWFRSR